MGHIQSLSQLLSCAVVTAINNMYPNGHSHVPVKLYLQQVVAAFGPRAVVYQAPALTRHTPFIPFMTLITFWNDLIYLLLSFFLVIILPPLDCSLLHCLVCSTAE